MEANFSLVQPPHFLKLLAHEIRWNLLILLTRSDYRVQELVQLVKQPQNLVSYHLRRLRAEGIVKEHRSAADSRDVYYSLDFPTLSTCYTDASTALHPALGRSSAALEEMLEKLPQHPLRVLFLCTGNSARSQMAEGLLRALVGERMEVYSAGTNPSVVNPLAIRVMQERGIDISHHRSKHLSEFLQQPFDVVITVCDHAAERCPLFPGPAKRLHWSFPDPAAVTGSEEAKLQAFRHVCDEIATRLLRWLEMFSQGENQQAEKGTEI